MNAKNVGYCLLMATLIFSCNSNTTRHKVLIKYITKHTDNVNPNSTNQIIDFPCAILIEPTDEAIAKLKKSTGDDYPTIVDDNEYYMSEASTFLDSAKVKQLNRESKGSLIFKTFSGEQIEMKIDTLNWGILLFNGKSRPILADMTMIQDNYTSYMK